MPLSLFYKKSQSRDGLTTQCKDCILAQRQIYRSAPEHKKRHNELNRIYYYRNLDKVRARYQRFILKLGRSKYNAIKRKWTREHREKRQETLSKYKIKKKLQWWLAKNNIPLIRHRFGQSFEECPSCGMNTKTCDLFNYDGKWICIFCLVDVRDIKIAKPKVKKQDSIFDKCEKCKKVVSIRRAGFCLNCWIDWCREKRKLKFD